jgi:hypothetical protein
MGISEDLKQSNFGLEDLAQNTGGYTQVNSNKIYVYFNIIKN